MTDELLAIVKEQLFAGFPPLEHAPDQITVRPPGMAQYSTGVTDWLVVDAR